MLAYTPMLHARLFKETARFRDDHFQPTKSSLISTEKSAEGAHLDGNPKFDRPLFVQFCANKPEDLLAAAQYVAPYCDAVDLNLGCPQGIAKAGHYGAFLQEDWKTIHDMISTLHQELDVPITAKMRILENKERTLDYAKMILKAGAQILTVHGRQRHQKGHNTGLADWKIIRYLRDNLPAETVLFANGNILNSSDIDKCLEATGADGVMSAEGNLSDPTIFADPPSEHNPREYWYDRSGNSKGGYRMDAVLRRYLDIIHTHVLNQEPPSRAPHFIPGDPLPQPATFSTQTEEATEEPPSKKRKPNPKLKSDPNLKSMQGHLFQLLRPLVSKHTNIRDALARTRVGDIEQFEKILSMVEEVTRVALIEEQDSSTNANAVASDSEDVAKVEELTPKQKTELIYARPWWVCQPHIRPLPEEALVSGALKVSKKDLARAAVPIAAKGKHNGGKNDVVRTDDGLDPEKLVPLDGTTKDLPQPALVCG
jgi:tRNA-dihydrouridine synthase 1